MILNAVVRMGFAAIAVIAMKVALAAARINNHYC